MVEPEEKQPPQKLDRKLMEQLMFGTGRVRRFTQDSPVLPDVWLEYAKAPEERSLPPQLANPAGRTLPAGEAAAHAVPRALHGRRADRAARTAGEDAGGARVARRSSTFPRRLPRVVYNQSTVAVDLYFEELIRIVLPMTDWWSRLDQQWKIGTWEWRPKSR